MKFNFDILYIGVFIIFIILLLFYKVTNKEGTYFTINENINNIISNIENKNNFIHPKKPNFTSRGETLCCKILSDIFNKPFVKKRPTFLNNPIGTGNNLEIDCYNEELKIGLEYNGKQHYEYTPFFHKNYEAFQNQKYKDVIKKYLCSKNNIFLITIPYTVKEENFKKEIIKQLKTKKNGY